MRGAVRDQSAQSAAVSGAWRAAACPLERRPRCVPALSSDRLRARRQDGERTAAGLGFIALYKSRTAKPRLRLLPFGGWRFVSNPKGR
jgi:hypothetical protein